MSHFLLNSFDHDTVRRSHADGLDDGNIQSYFTELKKEAITPPNNNNEGDGSPSLLQLKSEPMANPSSPESASIELPQAQSSNGGDECAGCGRLIQVNFKIKLNLERFLH